MLNKWKYANLQSSLKAVDSKNIMKHNNFKKKKKRWLKDTGIETEAKHCPVGRPVPCGNRNSLLRSEDWERPSFGDGQEIAIPKDCKITALDRWVPGSRPPSHATWVVRKSLLLNIGACCCLGFSLAWCKFLPVPVGIPSSCRNV